MTFCPRLVVMMRPRIWSYSMDSESSKVNIRRWSSQSTTMCQGFSTPSMRRMCPMISAMLNRCEARASRFSMITVSSVALRLKRSPLVRRGLRTRRLRSSRASTPSLMALSSLLLYPVMRMVELLMPPPRPPFM